MEMPVARRIPDFLETMRRMYDDSKILFEKGEYYNSCYLSGYVLECALKFLLCCYGKKPNGDNYTWRDVKEDQHKLGRLNQRLEECLSITNGIPPQYRLDCFSMCPYIFIGREGYPHWDPKFRYGECPAWDDEQYCRHYIEESEKIFRFISGIITGGVPYDSL